MNIEKLLNAAKAQHHMRSDSELARKIGVSQNAVWKWRNAQDLPKPEYAATLAELAGLNPAEVVAECLAKGAKNLKLKAIYATFKKSVAAILPLAMIVPALLDTIHKCILCNILPIGQKQPRTEPPECPTIA